MSKLGYLLLATLCLTINYKGTQSCYCDSRYYLGLYWDFDTQVTISVAKISRLYFYVDSYDLIYCSDSTIQWMILRADGESEVYTVLDNSYWDYDYYNYYYDAYDDIHYTFPERGLYFNGVCGYGFCQQYMAILPTDLRYNGAQITGVVNIPECLDSPNVTTTVTINIEGILYPGPLEAPPSVMVEIVSAESMVLSWSPPITINGVPILYYTVSVVNHGAVTDQINTTETNITLARPCTSTTYQISAWNEVGKGSAADYEFSPIQVFVKAVSDQKGICVSCFFSKNSTTEGCAIKLQNDNHTFSFYVSRQKSYDGLILLECFKVPEAGVFNVLVYEIEPGGTLGHQITCASTDVKINTGNESQTEHMKSEVVYNNITGDTAAVTGLTTALCVLVACIIVLITVMLFLMWKKRNKNTSAIIEAPNDTTGQRQTGSVKAAQPGASYINVQLPVSVTNPADENMYDIVGDTQHNATHEEIQLSANAAYGRPH